MPHTDKREIASKRVRPTRATWKRILARANSCCEWQEDGQACRLENGAIDPIGGGTVKLTPDHTTPHSVDPNSDPEDENQWQALCGRHQVMKKNFWDGATGKVNLMAILQAAGVKQKREAFEFLKSYFAEKSSKFARPERQCFCQSVDIGLPSSKRPQIGGDALLCPLHRLRDRKWLAAVPTRSILVRC